MEGNARNLQVYCVPVNDKYAEHSPLALQVKDKYPEAYKMYKERISSSRLKNQGNIVFSFTRDRKIIVWLFCKYAEDLYINPRMFQMCLTQLATVLPEKDGYINFLIDDRDFRHDYTRLQAFHHIQNFAFNVTLNVSIVKELK